MKGLLLKDFYMTLKYCRVFFVIVVIFLITGSIPLLPFLFSRSPSQAFYEARSSCGPGCSEKSSAMTLQAASTLKCSRMYRCVSIESLRHSSGFS